MKKLTLIGLGIATLTASYIIREIVGITKESKNKKNKSINMSKTDQYKRKLNMFI